MTKSVTKENIECLFGHHEYKWLMKGKSKIYKCTKCGNTHPDYPVLKTITYKKWGYELRDVVYDNRPYGMPGITIIRNAYTLSGDYIGNNREANNLCKKLGIKPEKRSTIHNVCSIGFREENQKWYGWSHRACCGFSVGDSIKKGDCAYSAGNKKDFIAQCVAFWDSDDHLNIMGVETKNDDGEMGVYVTWTYSDKIPNKKLRGVIVGKFTEYPKEFGKGEWTAKTLEDCKQMAINFAEGVA